MTFLKWLGGKSRLMEELINFFPDMNKINGYIEPFLGGGSVFFYLKRNGSLENKKIYLSDINTELINCYLIVRDNLDELIDILDKLEKEHNEKFYYKIRDHYFSLNLDAHERAACFIYLNKACFNGMNRFNSEGNFNMPIGRREKIGIYDADNLNECSKMLHGVNISAISFENILEIVKMMKNKDCFIYEDPPYDDIRTERRANCNFKRYTECGFDKRTYLKSVFKELDDLGCKVMMSNVASPMVLTEFKDYSINKVKTKRMVAANSLYRGEVEEIVITNYVPVKRQTLLGDY